MAWMKAYPKDHDPFYLFILINDILSTLPDVKPADSRLCQMLASKALLTAAKDTTREDADSVGFNSLSRCYC